MLTVGKQTNFDGATLLAHRTGTYYEVTMPPGVTFRTSEAGEVREQPSSSASEHVG